jgi:hypothetical protein
MTKLIIKPVGENKQEFELDLETAKKIKADYDSELISGERNLDIDPFSSYKKKRIDWIKIVKGEEDQTGDEKWKELEKDLKREYAQAINTPPEDRFDIKRNYFSFKIWCLLQLGERNPNEGLMNLGKKYATAFFKKHPEEIHCPSKVYDFMAKKEKLQRKEPQSELMEVVANNIKI